ncbi:hypothetical protein I4F81_000023 [Pyropia yezoensis]|uniref:Uncharacterized protein n=1 Tax=Pyropia yezoensis TaxID=2788 RepID=A0ACC3BHR0_PYRYE|nr:hypothetical protein I4F81_000023 [Neopyropia yezoensis]
MATRPGAALAALAATPAAARRLFVIAHALVDADPRSPAAWLAVGYYYLADGRPGSARRYLAKATALDRRCVAGWVALGHALAAADESDAALGAYRSAGRLSPGAPAPPVYMGMEYARQGNALAAESLWQGVLADAPGCGLALAELGGAAYRRRDFAAAVALYRRALVAARPPEAGGSGGGGLPPGVPERWPGWGATPDGADEVEVLLLNVGHALRRVGDWAGAAAAYERAAAMRPGDARTAAAVGMAAEGDGRRTDALAAYHRAAAWAPADGLIGGLLAAALGGWGGGWVPRAPDGYQLA